MDIDPQTDRVDPSVVGEGDIGLNLYHVVIVICIAIFGFSVVVHSFWEDFRLSKISSATEQTPATKP